MRNNQSKESKMKNCISEKLIFTQYLQVYDFICNAQLSL